MCLEVFNSFLISTRKNTSEQDYLYPSDDETSSNESEDDDDDMEDEDADDESMMEDDAPQIVRPPQANVNADNRQHHLIIVNHDQNNNNVNDIENQNGRANTVEENITNLNGLKVYPCSLKNITRLRIKELMPDYNPSSVAKLPYLPEVLKKFVSFQDEIDLIKKLTQDVHEINLGKKAGQF